MRQHFDRLSQRALSFYPEGDSVSGFTVTHILEPDRIQITHTQGDVVKTIDLSLIEIAGAHVVNLDIFDGEVMRKRVIVEDPSIFKHLETPQVFFVKHSKPLSQLIRKQDLVQVEHIEALEAREREDARIEKDLLKLERAQAAQQARDLKDANRLKYNQKKEG